MEGKRISLETLRYKLENREEKGQRKKAEKDETGKLEIIFKPIIEG